MKNSEYTVGQKIAFAAMLAVTTPIALTYVATDKIKTALKK